jgi:hypothetical protein
MLSVVMLNVVMLSAAMLSVIMLSVAKQNVVAPSKQWLISCKYQGANSQNCLKCFCFLVTILNQNFFNCYSQITLMKNYF